MAPHRYWSISIQLRLASPCVSFLFGVSILNPLYIPHCDHWIPLFNSYRNNVSSSIFVSEIHHVQRYFPHLSIRTSDTATARNLSCSEPLAAACIAANLPTSPKPPWRGLSRAAWFHGKNEIHSTAPWIKQIEMNAFLSDSVDSKLKRCKLWLCTYD